MALLLCFGSNLQVAKMTSPQRREIVRERAEGAFVDSVESMLAVSSDVDHRRLAQECEVLGDRAERHVELSGDVSRRLLLIPNQPENGPAPGLRDDLQ